MFSFSIVYYIILHYNYNLYANIFQIQIQNFPNWHQKNVEKQKTISAHESLSIKVTYFVLFAKIF